MNKLMNLSAQKKAVEPSRIANMNINCVIDPKDINLIREIEGKGKFGTVYEGKCHGLNVAIKIPKKQILTEEELNSFQKEVEIMSKIFCPNINLFMGASTKPFTKIVESSGKEIQGNILIVTELMKGDLESLLKDKKIHLSLFTRMQMAKDIAQGLAWLHGNDPVIIHRDLKASNLLYDERYTIKLCDFGLSQIKPKNIHISDPKGKIVGTLLTTAPEVMQGMNFNEKADVYSFSLIVWQLLTRDPLFLDLQNSFVSDFKEAICEKNLRPEIPDYCPPTLRNLLEKCWSANPQERYNFTEILEQLEHILIESILVDESAIKFWSENFFEKFIVPFKNFCDTFFKFVDIQQPKIEHIQCLKILLCKSEEYVTIEKFGKLIGHFGPLDVAFVYKIENICKSGWFYGELSTVEAENKLASSSPGTFLVRFANSPNYPNGFCITKVTRQRKIVHMRILHPSPYQYILQNAHIYTSLEDIIADSRIHLDHPYPNPNDALDYSSPFCHIFSLNKNSHQTMGYIEDKFEEYENNNNS